MKIWVDDIRPVPEGYVGTKSVDETIALIEKIEREGGKIALLDLDHDLGDYAQFGGDAIKILDYLAERRTFYPIEIHTANPVGRANMDRMIKRYWPSIGYPKYERGDFVEFGWNGEVLQGVIEIVDAYGTFEQNEEPSYDIGVEGKGLYKHVRESEVIGRKVENGQQYSYG